MTSTRPVPAVSCSRRRLASSAVRSVHTPSRAASASFGHGRARVPVAISRRSKPMARPSCEVDPASVEVQAGRGYAAQPFGVQVLAPGQHGGAGRHLAGEHLLGQRRPVVGFARLVADQRQRPGEPLSAQGRRRTQAGQGGADDDDAPVAPEAVAVRSRLGVRHGPAAGSRAGTRVAVGCGGVDAVDVQGLDRAGRRGAQYGLAPALGGVWVIGERLPAVHREDLGGHEDALAIPLAPCEIDDDPHRVPPLSGRGLPPAPPRGAPFLTFTRVERSVSVRPECGGSGRVGLPDLR